MRDNSAIRPSAIFVDGSNSYDMAFELAFECDPKKVGKVELVKRVGIRARETNNIVERLHGTMKDRLKPMRGLKHVDTGKAILDGMVVNYNFLRPHSALKGKTPAQAAGLNLDLQHGWKDLIQLATKNETLANSKAKANGAVVVEVQA